MKPIDQHILERTDAYLLGRISPSEKAEVETSLRSHPEYAEALHGQRMIMDALGYRQMHGHLHAVFEHSALPVRRRFTLWSVMAVAAGLLVILFLVFQTNQRLPASDALYAEFYLQDPGLPTLMGEPSRSRTFDEGMVLYKTGAYTEALSLWSGLATPGNTSDTLSFYLAMAHLGNAGYAQAAALLEEIPGESAFAHKKLWYRALLALRDGDHAQARALLTAVSSSPGLFQGQAEKLIRRIPLQKNQ